MATHPLPLPHSLPQHLRALVHDEVLLLFEDIKEELEQKIKSIDRNILHLRQQLQGLQHLQQLGDIAERIERIEAEMQLLKYHQQNSILVSRTKSLDKDRKPIFKKEEGYDFSTVILGLTGDSSAPEKKEPVSRPPLPRSKSLQGEAKQEGSQPQGRIFKRNPVLESSSSIHRWLHESDSKREFSCFSGVIREQEIEESVFI